jgi:hypothetical protein
VFEDCSAGSDAAAVCLERQRFIEAHEHDLQRIAAPFDHDTTPFAGRKIRFVKYFLCHYGASLDAEYEKKQNRTSAE